MIKITIKNLASKTIHCSTKTKSLLEILQSHYIDWMHACGGKGRCTTCKAIILSGGNDLEEPNQVEHKYMKQGKLAKNERLTCQTIVTTDLEIMVPEIYKLPHMQYSE